MAVVRNPSSPRDADDMSITSQATKIVEGLPATDLIKVLLRHIATDVAQFLRNARSWNEVYNRSRLVYDVIQDLMRQIDNGDEQADAMALWDSFQRYTAAIPPLERILLKFYSHYRLEHQRQLLPPTDSIESTIIYIETWKFDSKELQTTFGTFGSESNFVLAVALAALIEGTLIDNYNVHRMSDDMQTFRALVDAFKAFKIGDNDIVKVPSSTSPISAAIPKLAQLPSTHASTEITLLTILLIYIPFAYLSVQATPKDWKNYYKSTIIWEALLKSSKPLKRHLEPKTTITVETLEGECETLKILLFKVSEALETLEGPLLELLNVELVKMLFQLYLFSTDNRSNATRQFPEIEELFIESIATLEGAKAAVTDIKTITLVSDEYKKQDVGIKTVVGKVATAYSTVGLADKWSAKETLFTEAVKIDEDHLTMMRKRLNLGD